MKTQVRKRKVGAGRPVGRVAAYADEAYLIGTAARLAGLTVHEYLSNRLRDRVRRELIGHGLNPDRLPATVEA